MKITLAYSISHFVFVFEQMQIQCVVMEFHNYFILSVQIRARCDRI